MEPDYWLMQREEHENTWDWAAQIAFLKKDLAALVPGSKRKLAGYSALAWNDQKTHMAGDSNRVIYKYRNCTDCRVCDTGYTIGQ